MPETWNKANEMPDITSLPVKLERICVGAYFIEGNKIAISKRADMRSPYWFGIASHEYAHSIGANEEKAFFVQQKCENEWRNK